MGGHSRRRVLAAMGAAAAVGLAGCGGQEGPGGGSAGGESSTSPAPTATDSAVDAYCGPLTGSPTAYDTAGTPYIFTFDYIDSWTVEDPRRVGANRSQRIVSPELPTENGVSTATVRISQYMEPVTKATAEANHEEQMELSETNGFTYETDFNGETVEFLELPNVDVRSYSAYLPYGDGERRYYGVGVVTYLDGAGPGENIGDCTDGVNVNTRTVRDSLAENPDTTIDEL